MKITRLLLLCCSCESTVFTSTNAKSFNDRAALLSIHRRNHNHNHNSLIHILRGGAAARNTPTTASNRRSTKTTAQPPVPGAYVKKINPHFAVLYGMILAFNSGLMNGVTLSGILSTTKQPSSAVTGSWTNSALGVASGTASHGNYLAVKCIISYMGGSFISGLLNPYPMNYSMKRNTVRPCFIIASLAMYISSVLVGNDKSATGGSSNNNWILLIVLANGIQNSITSTLTGNLMRSAHYSGITSDIGTFMGQALRGNKTNGLKLKVFVVLAWSFWLGGFFSLGVVEKFGSGALLMSSILYLFFSLFSI